MASGIQPGLLACWQGNQTLVDNGFLARLILTGAPGRLLSTERPPEPEDDGSEQWQRHLLDVHQQGHVKLRLSKEARALVELLEDEATLELNRQRVPGLEAAILSKRHGLAVRYAGVIHLLRAAMDGQLPGEVIGEDVARVAVALAAAAVASTLDHGKDVRTFRDFLLHAYPPGQEPEFVATAWMEAAWKRWASISDGICEPFPQGAALPAAMPPGTQRKRQRSEGKQFAGWLLPPSPWDW